LYFDSVSVLVGNLGGKDPLKYLDLDGKKLLRHTLKMRIKNVDWIY